MNRIVIERELLESLYYGNEYTYDEIAKIFKCSRPTILSKMKEYKFSSRRDYDDIEKELLEGLYLGEELTTTEIAKLFNYSQSYITNQLKYNGIDRRKDGWQLSGKNNPFYGKHHTEETKKKIASKKIGKKLPKEQIEKMVKGREWYSHSEETKRKIGNSQPNKGKHIRTNTGKTHFKKGQISWNNGIPCSNITKEKISNALTGKYGGDKSPSWKGGLTEKNYGKKGIRLKDSFIEKKWRKSIYERDNWICQFCHDMSKKEHPVILNAHHIKSWRDYPDDRYKIENGITLCIDCHRYVHRIDILSQQ